MSGNKRTKKVLAARDARILAHARAGLNVVEICDVEGMDARNPTKVSEIITAGGAKPRRGAARHAPVGLMDVPHFWRSELGGEVYELLRNYSQPAVSAMIGLTAAELRKTQCSKSRNHNWTIAQLQRLAEARDITFKELIERSWLSKL